MTSHQVALTFEDGVTRFIRCAEDQTVADASYRSRINIPLDCRDGACGTCKALCESGRYDGGAYIEDALTPAEAADGYVLPCSMKPRSDLVLQIASTSEVAKTRAATYAARVTGLQRLSATTMSLTLETPERDRLAFLPGQYVNIAVPGTDETRSYSFSSAPDDKELTFLVKLTPGGVMSTWLSEQASVGDEITFTGPNGSFFLREAERPLLLLAGGTGLAPILSILRRLRDSAGDRPVHLVYGVSTDEDLVELDRIEELAAALPAMTWDHCVADPDSRAANKGYVTSLVRPEHLHDGDVAVYLCGPPPMVEAVRSDLAERGVVPTGFYYEKFALSGPAPTESAEPQPVAEPMPEEVPQPAPGQTSGTPAPAAADASSEVGPNDPVPGGADGPVPAATGARSVAGQEMLPAVDVAPVASGPAGVPAAASGGRSVAGQEMLPAVEVAPVASGPVRVPAAASGGRSVAGQEMLPAADLLPVTPAPGPASPVAASTARTGGYEIGEEHPSVHESDALFEARAALELGALDLVLGRIDSRQLAGYRLLAESTVPYVQGDRFTDAAAYTESNAAFHDYLFGLTGNEHLRQAYRALGVQGHMEEVLRTASWCHPRCAQDHLDLVDAIEAGDRPAARTLIADHAERSKATMRRAMADAGSAARRAFVTPGRFAGQVVLVTGAAQGIGERTARRIAAEGGTLVLADRSGLVEDLAAELAGAGGNDRATDGGSLPVVADLETWEGAKSVVDAAVARFGRVDVAVHTVGGTIWAKPFEHYPPEQIQAEINRSLFPTLWCCRAVAPHMFARGSGTIVNVSSVATRGVHRVPYAAAKGGVNAITSALALEAAPYGVRVVATAPGGTDAPPRRIPRGPGAESAQERQWYQAIVDQTVDSSLMKRYGSLDEQAAAITFLASEEASYITGTVLPVAGGDLG